jgi:hypothetical protein
MGNCRVSEHLAMKDQEHLAQHRLNLETNSRASSTEVVTSSPIAKESVDQLFADQDKRVASQFDSLPEPLRRLASIMFPLSNETSNSTNAFTPRA